MSLVHALPSGPPDLLAVDDLHALADLPAGDRPRPRDMALCRILAGLHEAAVSTHMRRLLPMDDAMRARAAAPLCPAHATRAELSLCGRAGRGLAAEGQALSAAGDGHQPHRRPPTALHPAALAAARAPHPT